MQRFTASFLLLTGIAFMFSSCFLFRKAETSPPVVSHKEAPAVTHPERIISPPPKEVVPAPFDVPAFTKRTYRPVYNVALFTPLDIDQVVSDTGFSVNDHTPLPPATLSGLEFYEGALLAMDSLQQEGVSIKLAVYDTKSQSGPIQSILRSHQLDSTNLIIGDVNGAELREISSFAKEKQINFISAIYPNDAGISENPFLTIMNSTLAVHCLAIQNFTQQKFSDKNILVIYQNNPQEKQNLAYIQQAYKAMNYDFKTPLYPFEWNNNATATVNDLLPHLVKGKNNVIMITALYPQVALSIIGQLIPLTKTYMINVVGMPTLDGNQDLKKNEYYGINVYYSTPYPYYNAGANPAIRSMMWQFFNKYRSRPSDMALKGYEIMFYFCSLLHENGVYFNANMNIPKDRLYTQFNIQPVYKNNNRNEPPDYFENMHLYFVQVRDGKTIPAN